MRTILFLAVLLAAPAQAEVIARAQNEGGGQIVLTDEPCPKIKNAYRIITYSDAGTIRGCWGPFKYDQSRIVVLWEGDTSTRTYRIDQFHATGVITLQQHRK